MTTYHILMQEHINDNLSHIDTGTSMTTYHILMQEYINDNLSHIAAGTYQWQLITYWCRNISMTTHHILVGISDCRVKLMLVSFTKILEKIYLIYIYFTDFVQLLNNVHVNTPTNPFTCTLPWQQIKMAWTTYYYKNGDSLFFM